MGSVTKKKRIVEKKIVETGPWRSINFVCVSVSCPCQ